ncbi:hypothetical protein [Actinomyces sp.]
MTLRRLLTASASLALALTGIAVPSAGSWEASAAQATAVVVSSPGLPAHGSTADQTTNARVSAPAPMRRRFRSRTTSHDPVAVVISLVLFALIAGGYYLFRYLANQGSRRQMQTVNYNGPSGPQYGVTGNVYGGSQYPQAGAPMNPPMRQGNGYGTADYGNSYGSQQGDYPSSGMNGGYGSYGSGY